MYHVSIAPFSFNSGLVRLIVCFVSMYLSNITSFQFRFGAIDRNARETVEFNRYQFQFRFGAIDSLNTKVHDTPC